MLSALPLEWRCRANAVYTVHCGAVSRMAEEEKGICRRIVPAAFVRPLHSSRCDATGRAGLQPVWRMWGEARVQRDAVRGVRAGTAQVDVLTAAGSADNCRPSAGPISEVLVRGLRGQSPRRFSGSKAAGTCPRRWRGTSPATKSPAVTSARRAPCTKFALTPSTIS